MPPQPLPLSNSQNLAKDQALAALPPVHGRGGPVMHSHRSVHHDLPHQRRLQIFIHVPQSGPAAHIWGQWGFVKTW